MTLIEACQSVNKELNKIEQMRKADKDLQIFKQISESLDDIVTPLAQPLDTLILFRNNGIDVTGLPQEEAHRLNEILTSLQKNYHNDPSFLSKDKTLRDILRSMSTFQYNIRSALGLAWARYTQKHIKYLNDDLLNVLAAVPQFKNAVDSIRVLQGQLRILSDKLPDTECFQDFQNMTLKLNQLWKSLKADDLPTEVIGFLRSVGEDGAPLDSLTEEVRQWLRNRHIEESFHVVIRQTP